MNTDAYSRLAEENSLGRLIDVKRIKRGNDIDRIVTSDGSFFCKTYTKSWYGRPEENSYPVSHEAGAYAVLKANGLPTPEVVKAETSAGNPLGRPYLLMRELKGTTVRQAPSMGKEVHSLLSAAGDYLRRMHAIQFKYPGYVCHEHGPDSEPDPRSWRHTHWASEVLMGEAKARWEGGQLPPWLHDRLLRRLEDNEQAIGGDYLPPRMLHGDCHVDQFFFDGHEVIGVVDMEVASSGAPIGDLVKFSIEASSSLSGIEWWRPFFDGYGQDPDLEMFKLRLSCCEWPEFKCQSWDGTYGEILERIYRADSWVELFNCSSVFKTAQQNGAPDADKLRR